MSWRPDVPLKHAFNVGKTYLEKGYRFERLNPDNPEHIKLIESESFQDLTWATFAHADDMMTKLPDSVPSEGLSERQIRTEALKITLRDPKVNFMVAYPASDNGQADRPVAFSVGKLFESPESNEAYAIGWYTGVGPDAKRSGLGRDLVQVRGKIFEEMAAKRGLEFSAYFAEPEHPGRVDPVRAAADPMSPEDRFKWYVSQGAKVVPVDYRIDWTFAPQFHEQHKPEGTLAERTGSLVNQGSHRGLPSVDDVEDTAELTYCLMSYPVKGKYATPEQVRNFIVAYHTDTYRVDADHPQLARMVKETVDWQNSPGKSKNYYRDPVDIIRNKQVILSVSPEELNRRELNIFDYDLSRLSEKMAHAVLGSLKLPPLAAASAGGFNYDLDDGPA